MEGSRDRRQMPTPGLDSQSQRQLRKVRVRALWHPIQAAAMHFLAYQEMGGGV